MAFVCLAKGFPPARQRLQGAALFKNNRTIGRFLHSQLNFEKERVTKQTSLPPVPNNAHRVVACRHGESEFNNANIFTGWCECCWKQASGKMIVLIISTVMVDFTHFCRTFLAL